MTYQVFLISSAAKSFEILTFNDISINKSTPVSPMPLPEEDSDENMLMKIEGNSTTIQINWILLESSITSGEGVIAHNGTKWAPATNKGSYSVWQQIQALDELSPSSLTDFYTLAIYDTEVTDEPLKEFDGMIQGITWRTDSSSPVNWTAQLQFIQGNVITTLSGNTHEAPTGVSASFSMSGSNRNGFIANFSEFQNYTEGDRPETTGATIRYKKNDGVPDFWREKSITFSANTSSPYNYTNKVFYVNDIDGVNNTKPYKIKISLDTDAGRGDWSDEVSLP